MKNTIAVSRPLDSEERNFLAILSELIRSENTRNLVLGLIGAIFCTCVFVISTQTSLGEDSKAIAEITAWKDQKEKNDNDLKLQLHDLSSATRDNSKVISDLTEAIKKLDQRQWDSKGNK